jgi:hypothetical protein
MKDKAIKKIASYSNKYLKEYLYDEYGKEDGRKGIQEEPFKALEFFFGHSFYQGRRDNQSSKADINARETLRDYIKEKGGDYEVILKKDNHKEIRSRLEKVIGGGEGRAGKGRDIDMVISILEFISKKEDKNIVSYSIDKIKGGKIKELYEEIDGITQIGQKCDAFFLRDVVHFYDLKEKVGKDEFVYLQPIDTWVAQVSSKIKIIEPSAKDRIELNYEIYRKQIVDACQKIGVSSIEYNQGAWYVAANSFDVLMDLFMEK